VLHFHVIGFVEVRQIDGWTVVTVYVWGRGLIKHTTNSRWLCHNSV